MVAIEKLRGHLIGELFSQVSVGGLKPVAAKIYYLLLFREFLLLANKWQEPAVCRKIMLFQKIYQLNCAFDSCHFLFSRGIQARKSEQSPASK